MKSPVCGVGGQGHLVGTGQAQRGSCRFNFNLTWLFPFLFGAGPLSFPPLCFLAQTFPFLMGTLDSAHGVPHSEACEAPRSTHSSDESTAP